MSEDTVDDGNANATPDNSTTFGFSYLEGTPVSDRFEQLVYQVHDGVAHIRLDRPEVLNAFSAQLYAELKDAIRLANADDGVDIVVIRGTGRSFATGGDLKEFLGVVESDDPLAVFRFEDSVPFETIRESPKTIISAVNGICVAGGLVVAMTSDLAIASESASFGIPEGRVGLADPYMPALLFGRVSLSRLKYLMYTGTIVDSAMAVDLGLVLERVPDEELAGRITALVAEIRQTSAGPRATYKATLNRITPRFEPYFLADGLSSPERLSQLQDFVRPPAEGDE